MGLINAAVPAERLDAEVAAAVDDLLAGGPDAIAAAKRLLARCPACRSTRRSPGPVPCRPELFAGDEREEG